MPSYTYVPFIPTPRIRSLLIYISLDFMYIYYTWGSLTITTSLGFYFLVESKDTYATTIDNNNIVNIWLV